VAWNELVAATATRFVVVLNLLGWMRRVVRVVVLQEAADRWFFEREYLLFWKNIVVALARSNVKQTNLPVGVEGFPPPHPKRRV